MSNSKDNSLDLDEQQAIRNRCFHPTRCFVEFRNDEVEQSIPQRFEQQAAKYPNQVAVRSRDCEFTYDALNQAANRMARAIQAHGEHTQAPIALLLDNKAPTIAAILGVLKSGNICVTLDPAFPRARLAHMLEDTQAGLVVTNQQNLELAVKLAQGKCPLLKVDPSLSDFSPENLNLVISPDAVAYIMYTSGTTGQPKGIVHSHRNVMHNVKNYTNNFRLCTYDRLTLLHSFSFSSGMVDTFCALLNGATLYPWYIKQEGMADLAPWLIQQGVTIFSWSPTPFRSFVETLPANASFPDLRVITLGGEPVTRRDFELYKQHFSPACIFVNRLGTTEANNFRLYFMDQTSLLAGNSVPAGYAVEGKEVVLLDEAGQQVEFNQVGEISIKSRYLTLGYWRKPELTAATFQAVPPDDGTRMYRTGDLGIMRPDGCLECLGRQDTLVKIRGHRVETSEVEIALSALEGIREAVVIAKEDQAGEKYLAAYFIPNNQIVPSTNQLRLALAQKLPDYMIPAVLVKLDDWPLSPTGKLDRRTLTDPEKLERTVSDTVAPRDTLEHQLVEIWEQVLGIRPISIRDNFFDLGGHSLLLVRLLSKIEQYLGYDIRPDAFFQAPTIELLARRLRTNRQMAESPVIGLRTTGSKPPFFCAPGNLGNVFSDLRYLARHMGTDQPFYGLQDGIQIPSRIKDVAAFYLKEVRHIHPTGPYLLGGICSGALVAFEMAQQLTAQGYQVGLVALIEPVYPWIPGLRSYLDFVQHYGALFFKRFARHSRNLSQVSAAEQQAFIQLKAKLFSNSWAFRNYSAKPYSGPLDVFVTQESAEKRPRAFEQDWQSLARGRLAQHIIPGTHNSITGNDNTLIQEAHMQALADQLKACVAQA